jgi:hypothetical protein
MRDLRLSRRRRGDLRTLLGYWAAQSGYSILTCRDNVPTPSSRGKKSRRPTGCSEASVRNYHSTLRSTPDGGQNSYRPYFLKQRATTVRMPRGFREGKGARKSNIKKGGPQHPKRQENAVLHNDPPGFHTVKVSRMTSF